MKTKFISALLALVLVLSVAIVPANAAGNNMATATTILFNNTYTGNLTESNTVDFYKFTFSKSGRVNLRLTAYVKETHYYLYDADGNELWRSTWQNWNSVSEEYNLDKDFDLTGGTYYFSIQRASGTGSYHFKLTYTNANETYPEPQGGSNNTIRTASAASFNKTYLGQLAVNDPKDIYKFAIKDSGRVSLTLKAYVKETAYTLYDEGGNEIWSKNWQTWNSVSEEYNLGVDWDLTAGTYYFSIQKVSGTGNYQFSMSYASARESFPETTGGINNALAAASVISPILTYRGQIAINDSKDFYKFTVTSACKVNLRVTAYIRQTSYYLYDESGNTVWSKRWVDWNSTSQEYNLNTTVDLSPGAYYFSVEQSSGTGNYQFYVKGDGILKINPFVDVKANDYFYNAVMWAYFHEPQVTGGTDKTHFSPNAKCTREQIVTFLYAAYNKPAYSQTGSPFSDVKAGSYYYDAVMWAVQNKITSGAGGGKFGVGSPCTREQVVTFLWKAAGSPKPRTTSCPFRDVPAGAYYYNAVLWAVEKGVTKGMTADTFGVGQTCTRGQVVVFLYKAAGN